jgi:hypothetical protein
MNKATVGTCGNCGGAVMVDTIFYSVVPPRPQCTRCYAYAGEDHGPVIPMEASPQRGASNKWFEILTGTSTDGTGIYTFPINTNKTTLHNK